MSAEPSNDVHRAVGVISGTSMDGIDVAVIETDGMRKVARGPGATYPYPSRTRERLIEIIADASRAETPLTELEDAVTQDHGDAIAQFLQETGTREASLHVIGFHGQTVCHRPERGFTRQLGSGAAIARRFGVNTVDRFRHADLAAGGQGAPLVPLYHAALAADLPRPLMVLNLGGVGNVTYIDHDVTIAFDTGPANAIIDDFVGRRRGLQFDAAGRLAASGKPRRDLIDEFRSHPFFRKPAPKSLDRNDFHLAAAEADRLSDADGAATLTEFTVCATIAALQQVPRRPIQWLVSGGGRRNTHLLRRLAEELGVAVVPVEAVGWNGDFLEAECFGYLAVRSLLGLPLSLPTTTGVSRPLTGGELHRPSEVTANSRP